MAIKDRVALVTGAGRGLGRALAVRLAADGAKVAVHYHDSREGAAQTVEAIRASTACTAGTTSTPPTTTCSPSGARSAV